MKNFTLKNFLSSILTSLSFILISNLALADMKSGDHSGDHAAEASSEKSYTDNAPPFTDKMRKKFSIDPDKVYQIVRPLIVEHANDKSQTVSDEEFLENLKGKIHEQMPFINKDAKKFRNKYHGVIGDIHILYATPWEYMILFKYKELEPQKGRGFWKQLNSEKQKLIQDLGLGFSGRYFGTEFRTIPVIGDQQTLTEKDDEIHVHKPGDRAFLKKGSAKFYKSGWILECAHGQLWKAVPRFIVENETCDVKGQVGAVMKGLMHRIQLKFQ